MRRQRIEAGTGMRLAALLTIAGGGLPLLLGAAFGFLDGNGDSHSWAYPMPVWAFVTMGAGLAVSHWLVATGYLATLRNVSGAAARFGIIALVGTIALGACELWSAALARSNKDGSAVGALNLGYGVCSVLIAAGSIGAGWLLMRSWRRVGLPLLSGGVFFLVVAMPLIAVGGDTAQVGALTVWSLFYIWLGLGLGTNAVLTTNVAADQRARV